MKGINELNDSELEKVTGGETMDSELGKTIASIISEQLGIPLKEINGDAKLITDFGLSSLDIVDLTQALEERFKIDISDSLFSLVKVIDVVNFISNKV